MKVKKDFYWIEEKVLLPNTQFRGTLYNVHEGDLEPISVASLRIKKNQESDGNPLGERIQNDCKYNLKLRLSLFDFSSSDFSLQLTDEQAEKMISDEKYRTGVCVFEAYNSYVKRASSLESLLHKICFLGKYIRNSIEFDSSVIHSMIKNLFVLLSSKEREDLIVELDHLLEK